MLKKKIHKWKSGSLFSDMESQNDGENCMLDLWTESFSVHMHGGSVCTSSYGEDEPLWTVSKWLSAEPCCAYVCHDHRHLSHASQHLFLFLFRNHTEDVLIVRGEPLGAESLAEMRAILIGYVPQHLADQATRAVTSTGPRNVETHWSIRITLWRYYTMAGLAWEAPKAVDGQCLPSVGRFPELRCWSNAQYICMCYALLLDCV